MTTITARFTRRFRFLRLLRASLALGALYDLALAFLVVAAPEVLRRLLGLPFPEERFYLSLLAVALVMLAALFLFAARDPRRYSAVILVAIVGRLAAAATLALAAGGQVELAGLYAPAALHFALGLLHGIFWLPIYS